jgi:hypothetical protein
MNKEATAPMKATYLFIPNNEPKHLIGAVLETVEYKKIEIVLL